MTNFDPDWVVAPGEVLKEWREEQGLSTRIAAKVCASMPQELYERVEAGERKINDAIALSLAYGTLIPARFWLRMEQIYRDGLAAGKVRM